MVLCKNSTWPEKHRNVLVQQHLQCFATSN